MSQESREVVRQRVALRASRRRRLLERFCLRFPRLGERLMHAVLVRNPNSTIRRTVVRLTVRWALEAVNRGDHEAAFAVLPPDYETITPPELAGLGLEPTYRGRDGRLSMQLAWMRDLGEFEQEAEEVIDTGDRIILLGRMMGTGLSSGANFESEVAYVLTVSGGRVVREELFRSHTEALEAAGLPE
jgi:ketosteroid isomerase-like protein